MEIKPFKKLYYKFTRTTFNTVANNKRCVYFDNRFIIRFIDGFKFSSLVVHVNNDNSLLAIYHKNDIVVKVCDKYSGDELLNDFKEELENG